MGETTGQIETHIRNKRDDLSANLNELERKVKSATDWRQHYKSHPGTFLAAAIGGGLVLSLIANQGKRRVVSQGSSETPQRRASSLTNGPVQQHIGEIKGALIGLAATQAKNILSKLVPGFEEQLAHREMQGGSETPIYRA